MTQTSAPQIDMDRGLNGQLADGISSHKDILTSKAASVALVIGRLCVVDQANGQDAAKMPTAALDITNLKKGVVLRAESQESTLGADVDWAVGSAVPTITKGRVYVEVEDAVTEGDKVFARHTGGDEGKFRSDNTNATEVVGAVYRTSTTGAGIAVVELN